MYRLFYGIVCLMLVVATANAADSGPEYIKEQLTLSGVYNAPSFEYTSAYDSYASSTNGDIKALFMEGLPYSKSVNSENRTKVFCWYGTPINLGANEKVPAVILIHGGGGEAYKAWVEEWTKRGYIAIALSLINKLPDGTEETEYAIPGQQMFFIDNNEELQDQWFYHAIGAVMLAQSLLRSETFTTQVDVDNIGITGISWGGINATVVTGIDERIAFSIPVYGSAYLKDSPVYSNQYSRMSTEAKSFYDKNWRGELYTPLHKCPMLFIDGNKDLQFTLNIFDRTYDSSASPEKYLRIENAMGHGHTAGRRPMEIYEFADYITGFNSSAIKPLEFTSETIDDDNKITYTYSYTGDIDEAILYYSKDTLEWGKTDENFIWLTQNATLTKNGNTGTITTKVPADAQVYYVNINNTSTGNIFSSTLKYMASTDSNTSPVEVKVFHPWLDYSVTENVVELYKYRDVGGNYFENYDLSLDDGVNNDSSETNKAIKFVKTSGEHTFAQIDFNFTDGVLDEDSVTFSVRTLFKPETITEINVIESGCTGISLFLKNSVGSDTETITQTSKTAYFVTTNEWQELQFTFSSTDLASYDQMFLIFASGYESPLDEDGNVLTDEDFTYYIDYIKSTIPINEDNITASNFEPSQKESLSAGINLSQNFANNTLNIEILNNNNIDRSYYTITDISGQRVLTAKLNSNRTDIDLNNLSAGVYSIQVFNNNKMYSKTTVVF